MGYNADQRGVALGLITITTTIVGAVFGGWVTTLAGLGHALWIFGFLQLFSNVGYYFLSILGKPVPGALYAATGFELLTSGMGTGAFAVLLLRLTEKRFSATQYALFSSLFALPRVIAGPITGFAVAAIGWSSFFLTTLVIGIPGLLMLNRFAPFGVREPQFEHERETAPVAAVSGLLRPGMTAAVGLAIVASLLLAMLDAMDKVRTAPGTGFDITGAMWRLTHPANPVAGFKSLASSPLRSWAACSSRPRACAGHARHPESFFASVLRSATNASSASSTFAKVCACLAVPT